MDEILIILALIVLNGIFAMSEVALISARKSRLKTDVKQGSKSAKTALELANNPDRFLSTVQIGITLIGILTGMFSGHKIAILMGDAMLRLGMPHSYAYTIGQGIIIVLVTFLSIIFGELVPKRIGMSMAEKMAKLMAQPMRWLSAIALPFVWLLSKSTELIFNLLGIKETENKVTEEEIKDIIHEGVEGGEVQPVEKDIMQRVFLMGDLKLNSIMTHKNEIVWFDIEASKEEVYQIINEKLYEFYPVADGDLDHVRGIINLKDLVFQLHSPAFSLKSIVREPVYFHEHSNVYRVMEQMKLKKISRALVCDEFGSCTGIITHKDILEGLIGTIEETDEEPDIIQRANHDGWLVDGQCSLYDFFNYFKHEELIENADYHTVAGLLIQHLGHIPQSGETLEWKNFHFEVVDMDGARIDKILVKLKETENNLDK